MLKTQRGIIAILIEENEEHVGILTIVHAQYNKLEQKLHKTGAKVAQNEGLIWLLKL